MMYKMYKQLQGKAQGNHFVPGLIFPRTWIISRTGADRQGVKTGIPEET